MSRRPCVTKRMAQSDPDGETDATVPLDDFRKLMGTLYGVAGIAHFADLVAGDSTLLASFGAPVFGDLSLPGQVYAIIWCLTGPIAFLASSRSSMLADSGLVAYGFVEVLGAFLLKEGGYESDMALTNAIGVQVAVAASWFYSSRKKL